MNTGSGQKGRADLQQRREEGNQMKTIAKSPAAGRRRVYRAKSAMARFVLLVGAAVSALVLGLAPAAEAANPQPTPFVSSGVDILTDFCGTGETVVLTYSIRGVEFLAPNGAESVFLLHAVITYSYGDVSLVNRIASRNSEVIVSGSPEGIHTQESKIQGLVELWTFDQGRLITRDAGAITFIRQYDGDEVISEEVVVHGPHPEVDSDWELGCQILPEALGIG
jgi:hypothetical protein